MPLSVVFQQFDARFAELAFKNFIEKVTFTAYVSYALICDVTYIPTQISCKL